MIENEFISYPFISNSLFTQRILIGRDDHWQLSILLVKLMISTIYRHFWIRKPSNPPKNTVFKKLGHEFVFFFTSYQPKDVYSHQKWFYTSCLSG